MPVHDGSWRRPARPLPLPPLFCALPSALIAPTLSGSRTLGLSPSSKSAILLPISLSPPPPVSTGGDPAVSGQKMGRMEIFHLFLSPPIR